MDSNNSEQPPQTRGTVFDPIREKLVARTPEELVRQAIIRYLIDSLKVPISLIGVEASLAILEPGNQGRVDIAVWQPDPTKGGLRPWLLIECKAPSVRITPDLAIQLARYLRLIPSRFLMVSNGGDSRFWEWREGGYQSIPNLPLYSLSENPTLDNSN